jgi:hypothetical protein
VGAVKVRKLTLKDVKVTLRAEPEDEPVRGSFGGDEDGARKVEDDVLAGLEGGNEWAWCQAVVEVSWGNFQGAAFLGCCSYESEEDFMQKGGYYEQMVEESLSDLNAGIAKVYAEICPLLE